MCQITLADDKCADVRISARIDADFDFWPSPAEYPEVVPGFGTTGLSGGAGCSVMVDGADDEENETEVRCRREGEDSA